MNRLKHKHWTNQHNYKNKTKTADYFNCTVEYDTHLPVVVKHYMRYRCVSAFACTQFKFMDWFKQFKVNVHLVDSKVLSEISFHSQTDRFCVSKRIQVLRFVFFLSHLLKAFRNILFYYILKKIVECKEESRLYLLPLQKSQWSN